MNDDSESEFLQGVEDLYRTTKASELVTSPSPAASSSPLPLDGGAAPAPTADARAHTRPQAEPYFPWAGWRPDPDAADDDES
jgi:hypothetical protein